jgi:transcriptional regulator with XRE-family HTH domain
MKGGHTSLGREIARLRIEKGWSLQQLAVETGVSATHLSRIERGVRVGSVPLLKRIALALGVPISHIAELSDNRRSYVREPPVNAA